VKFKKDWLQELVCEDHNEAKIIKNELYETSRWSLHYELVFEYQDKLYRTFYSRGATEQQYEQPFEYEDNEIDCEEVTPVVKQIIEYKDK